MKVFFFALLLLTGLAHAAKVEDVQIMDIKFAKASFEVKLRLKDAKAGSYFTVQISKDDEKSFEKLALVLKKAKQKDAFRLDLEIPSFSPQSGSFYRSNYVTFIGDGAGESLLAD